MLKRSAIKERFKKEFSFTAPKLSGTLKAKPITANDQLIGTAFDYLLRFYLQQKNPNCITRKWVAESSVLRMDKIGKKDGDSKKMKQLLKESKKTHADFLSDGKLDDKIIKTAIILGQMDMFKRIGKLHPDLGTVEEGDIEDLRNLISIVEPKLFISKKHCFLNPTFGSGSVWVGGADADLIVDDMLIDIKTTKHLSFTRDNFNQLIGYYVLSKLGKVNGLKYIQISKLGIYFSRYGILHTISTEQIENHKNFPKFVRWFKKSAIDQTVKDMVNSTPKGRFMKELGF